MLFFGVNLGPKGIWCLCFTSLDEKMDPFPLDSLTPDPGGPQQQDAPKEKIISRQLPEASRFAFAALCGVSLGQLFAGCENRWVDPEGQVFFWPTPESSDPKSCLLWSVVTDLSGSCSWRTWWAGWTWTSRWCPSWGLSCQVWAWRVLTPFCPSYKPTHFWLQEPPPSYR